MEGGRVNRSWCLGVVGHRYGELGCLVMEVVVGMHAGQRQERLVACLKMLDHFLSAR